MPQTIPFEDFHANQPSALAHRAAQPLRIVGAALARAPLAFIRFWNIPLLGEDEMGRRQEMWSSRHWGSRS